MSAAGTGDVPAPHASHGRRSAGAPLWLPCTSSPTGLRFLVLLCRLVATGCVAFSALLPPQAAEATEKSWCPVLCPISVFLAAGRLEHDGGRCLTDMHYKKQGHIHGYRQIYFKIYFQLLAVAGYSRCVPLIWCQGIIGNLLTEEGLHIGACDCMGVQQ
jgi:hypothetical protein